MNPIVTIKDICGKIVSMPRDKALTLYTNAVVDCEGSEQNRYASVVYGLLMEEDVVNECWDY